MLICFQNFWSLLGSNKSWKPKRWGSSPQSQKHALSGNQVDHNHGTACVGRLKGGLSTSTESTGVIIRVLGASAYNSRRPAALKSETWATKMSIPRWVSPWSIVSYLSLHALRSSVCSKAVLKAFPPKLHWLDPRLVLLHSKTRPAGHGSSAI